MKDYPEGATHYNTCNGLCYRLEDNGFMSVWSDWLEFWSETPHKLEDYGIGEMVQIELDNPSTPN